MLETLFRHRDNLRIDLRCNIDRMCRGGNLTPLTPYRSCKCKVSILQYDVPWLSIGKNACQLLE